MVVRVNYSHNYKMYELREFKKQVFAQDYEKQCGSRTFLIF